MGSPDTDEQKIKQIPIRVSEGTKRDWEQKAEEHGLSLAGLIRNAVRRQYFEDDFPTQGAEAAEVEIEPLRQDMSRVTDRLDTIETMLEEVTETGKEDDVQLENPLEREQYLNIYDKLPRIEDTPRELPAWDDVIRFDTAEERVSEGGYFDHIQQMTGLDDFELREILGKLRNREDEVVQIVDDDDGNRYCVWEGKDMDMWSEKGA